MSKLNINRLTNENEDGAPKITGITSFSSSAFLETPKGTTAQRPENVSPGMIRFNTDSGHLEYYNGVEWTEVLVANNTLDGGARGLFFGGGYGPTSPNTIHNIIDYITIATTGNALDFGDLTTARATTASLASSTRGVLAGGFSQPANYNIIDYVTISSTGNSQDFGDLKDGVNVHFSGCSSSTRGLFGGGWATEKNIIDYITIASTGDSVDFGDLTAARFEPGALSSSTRGVFAGGSKLSAGAFNTIDYVTISSTGNAVDFGDLSFTSLTTGLSNSTRGLFATATGASVNTIEFIIIASLGNAQDFGDQSVNDRYVPASFASSTRGIIGGGSAPSVGNVIDYVTILTTGNAQDFGDLTQGRFRLSGCSNAHGGL